MAPTSCIGLNCGVFGPPSEPQNVPSSLSGAPDASAAGGSAPAKAECGIGSCLPDDLGACNGYSPPAPTVPNGQLDGGVAADAGVDGGAVGADAGADAGAGGPQIDGSFNQPTRPDNSPSQFACQLSVTNNGSVARQCGAAGQQRAEQACTSSLDCAPGLGCVGTVRSGRCLPFCCGIGADSCAEGFYCAERPLRVEALGEADGPKVPVCDRADNCSLGEPFNCEGRRCVCGADTACQLVRPDGTTACVRLSPKPGQVGDACPCDRGLHCSQATGTCVKICDLDERDSDTCGTGVCQTTPVLPPGWGICVGVPPDQMPQP